MLKKKSIIAFAAGVVLIGLGFERLAAGSMTLAPFLLVLGYCVAIPVAIMLRDTGDGSDTAEMASESGE